LLKYQHVETYPSKFVGLLGEVRTKPDGLNGISIFDNVSFSIFSKKIKEIVDKVKSIVDYIK